MTIAETASQGYTGNVKLSKRDERFLQSTRGRIVSLLRGTSLTVDELSQELQLTDNAVRAHLATLERDGLVEQKGSRPGVRKSHHTFALSQEGDQLFPKAYDLLLNQLLTTLKGRLPVSELEAALEQAGRALAGAVPQSSDLETRLLAAIRVLAELGGSAVLERCPDRYVIASQACPLARVVCEHPEVCQLARASLETIIGRKVKETCTQGAAPKCRFEVPI